MVVIVGKWSMMGSKEGRGGEGLPARAEGQV
jgi:hypothetical protein